MSLIDADASPGIHLCVIVHGLWGNPTHLSHVASSLRGEFSEDILQILVAKRNSGNFTYDGIELGGERLTNEIENELAELERKGKKVKNISLVGYSLGGLVARYAIGLLYSKGVFDKLQPVNFTTFASPHLGVRTPLLGWHNQIFNVLGARTLSTSGQQLFLVDSFRETGRPLLSLLADPQSIFMRGLSAFRNRSLYANIVGDRAVPFYTAMITRIDPFVDLDAVNITYVPGYEDVIIDSDKLAIPKPEQPTTYYESLVGGAYKILDKAPLFLLFTAVIPIGSLVYLANSGVQSFMSAQRIRDHEDGKAGIDRGAYRFPLMIEGLRRRAESALENINATQHEEYLPDQPITRSGQAQQTEDTSISDGYVPVHDHSSQNGDAKSSWLQPPPSNEKQMVEAKDLPSNDSPFPTLALTPEQFAMIDSLDNLGFTKHAVHIHKARHSHAAIIIRTPRDAFSEGKIVSRHWLERFEV